MRLLITRPREDAEPLAALLGRRGIETLVEPLISIEDVGVPALELSGVQALLVTSANGVRAFARCHPGRDIAVLAVGDASARAARDLGFRSVLSATGDVEALAALVRDELDPAGGALLHIAGSHVAGDLAGSLKAAGFEYRREVLYEARAAEALSEDARTALAEGSLDGVVLFSPRTAAVFARLAADAGLSDACRGLSAYCLSPAVADRIRGLGWRDLIVAPHPDQDGLLDALAAGG